MERFRIKYLKFLVPLLVAILGCSIWNSVARLGFDAGVMYRPLWWDIWANVVFGYLLFAFSKSVLVYCLIHTLIIGLFYVSNAIKISLLGGPISPDDINYAIPSLLRVLGLGYNIVIGTLVFVLLAGLVMNSRAKVWAVALAVCCVVAGISFPTPWAQKIVKSVDTQVPYFPWVQKSNYRRRGTFLYLSQEFLRRKIEMDMELDKDKVDQAMANILRQTHVNTQPGSAKAASAEDSINGQKRNVYFFVLESFWDPTSIASFGLSQDPLDPRLRDLWQRGGKSTVISPVFGGGTANAEFELLCGIPVSRGIMFERTMNAKLPCLPRILSEHGYKVVAAHPNIPAFWNRNNSYRKVGFEDFWSQADFELDDLNGPYLADGSFLNQAIDKVTNLRRSTSSPVFGYMLTISGHHPYYLNLEKRPKVITAKAEGYIESYANSVYYTSREVMNAVQGIHDLDPTSVIILLGDHLPVLGKGFRGFELSNSLSENPDQDIDLQLKRSSPPLLVLNGRNNPLPLGAVSMFALPNVVLNLLDIDTRSLVSVGGRLPFRHLRPQSGRALVAGSERGQRFICDQQTNKKPNPECETYLKLMDDMDYVVKDVVFGKQWGLRLLE